VATALSALFFLISPSFLRIRPDARAGKGARHRNPGLPRVSPVARPGRHLLIRPDVDSELHADEVSW
jgi:hypothetical protein